MKKLHSMVYQIEGCLLIALGICLLKQAGIMVNGVAGAALLLEQAYQFPFVWSFTLINLPFLILAYSLLGKQFAFYSIGSVALVNVGALFMQDWLASYQMPELLSSSLGGMLVGFGMLAVVRGGSSVGGVTILAEWLRNTKGIDRAWTVLGCDLLVIAAAFVILPVHDALLSLLAMVALISIVRRYKSMCIA